MTPLDSFTPEVQNLLDVSGGVQLADIEEKISQKALTPYCVTNASGQFIAMNHAYAAFYGYLKGELLDKKASILLPVNDHSTFWDSYNEFIREGEGDRNHWKVNVNGIGPRHIRVTSVRIELADQGTCVISMIEPADD